MLHISILPLDISRINGLPKPDGDTEMDVLGLFENKIALERAEGADERSVRQSENLLGVLKQFE